MYLVRPRHINSNIAVIWQKNGYIVGFWQKIGYLVGRCNKFLAEDASSFRNLAESAIFTQDNQRFLIRDSLGDSD